VFCRLRRFHDGRTGPQNEIRKGIPVLLEFITTKETEVSRPGT
jgi:hypothetical protein